MAQDACRLQSCHGHQYAEEEEDGGHVDILHDLRHAVLGIFTHAHLVVPVNPLRDNPHHTEREHHPYIGW